MHARVEAGSGRHMSEGVAADMGMSARDFLERGSATWPLWQRRLAVGVRWPVHLIFILSGLIVGLRTALLIPVNTVVVVVAAVVLVACAAWAALGIAVEMSHLSYDVPEIAPAWLKRIMRVCLFPIRYGSALTVSLVVYVPLVVVFPSLRDAVITRIVVAFICLGLVPIFLMVAGVVLALPVVIPIGIVRNIRNRHDRRYRELYRNRRLPPW